MNFDSSFAGTCNVSGVGVGCRLRIMCLENGPAIPKLISSSGRKHPDRMSSRGDSRVLILTRFVVDVFGVFIGGVGAVEGVDDDDSGMMVMRGGLGLPSYMGFPLVVVPFVFGTTS